MSYRRNPLVSLGACLVFLVSGALHRQVLHSHQAEGVPSRPLTAPSKEFVPARESPVDLWARLSKKWQPGAFAWLEIRSRQRQHLGEAPFEAENHLVLGPGNCVHRRTELKTKAGKGRSLVVCDGSILAEAILHEGGPPKIQSEPLAPNLPVSIVQGKLKAKGCIGPYHLLVHLKERTREVRLLEGEMEGRRIYCLLGKVSAPAVDPEGPIELLAHRQVRILIDRETLAPMRLEWWLEGPDGQASRLLLEMDYLEVKSDQALSREDCIRLFSFNPSAF